MKKKDPRIGKIFVVDDEQYPVWDKNKKPRLLLVQNIKMGTDEEFEGSYYFVGYDSTGKRIVDSAVMLNYLREATSEEILLFWPENEKNGPA